MKSFAYRNGIFAFILIAMLLIFAGVTLAPVEVAYAVLPDNYNDYIESLSDENSKDWYFGEDYLNISEVLSVVNSWKTNPKFNLESIKNDPIVIAVIDSGIGHAYYDDGAGNELKTEKKEYYNTVDGSGNALVYHINPMIEDVILKDGDDNYVYESVVSKNVRGKEVCATLDDGINDMAYVLADNTDDSHGTHVTGIVALLIHALELEDYVKILPIKANDSVQKAALSTKYTAHYSYSDVQSAIEFARDNGADIVSLSLTADKSSFSFDAFTDDVLLCAAAGNSGSNSTFSPGYPAASPDVLGVMNYTYGDDGAELSAKSNYGMAYDVAAPGSYIISSIDGKDGYGVLSGTSMATPIVAFASALISVKYRAIENDTDLFVTPEIIKTMITLSAGETNDAKSMPTLDLLSLITTDFQSENSDDIFLNAEDIYIDGPDDLANMTLKDVQTITARAKTYPKNSRVNGTIEWWYEYGGEKTDLGTGNFITFTPPSVVGTYALYCRAVDVNGKEILDCSPENAFVFTINYATFEYDKIRIVGTNGSQFVGDVHENEPHIFTISDAEYVDLSKYSIVWFVDGKMIKGATGATFEFSSKKPGLHKVSARINGTYSYDVEFEVIANPEVVEKLPDYVLISVISSSVVASAIIVLIIVVIVVKRKKNKSTDKNYEIDDN